MQVSPNGKQVQTVNGMTWLHPGLETPALLKNTATHPDHDIQFWIKIQKNKMEMIINII